MAFHDDNHFKYTLAHDGRDFKEVPPLPNVRELLDRDPVFLPPKKSAVDEAALRERAFRLHREDVVAPLRDEVRALAGWPAYDAKKLGLFSIDVERICPPIEARKPPARPSHLDIGTPLVSILFKPPRAFFKRAMAIRAKLEEQAAAAEAAAKAAEPPATDDAKSQNARIRDTALQLRSQRATADAFAIALSEFFVKPGKLCRDNILCILQDNKPLHLAKVVSRKPILVAGTEGMHEVCLQFLDDPGREWALRSLLPRPPAKAAPRASLRVAQLSGSIYAHEAVLNKLTCADEQLPFADVFTRQEPWDGDVPGLVQPQGISARMEEIIATIEDADDNTDLSRTCNLSTELKLNSMQREAVVASLRQQISLVQGPPGTGKSLCGAFLAKVLLDVLLSGLSSRSRSILVVCQTNHAVDQFLEHLMDIGVSKHDMVRIGSSKKMSARVKELALTERSKVNRAHSKEEKRKWGCAKAREARALHDLERLCSALATGTGCMEDVHDAIVAHRELCQARDELTDLVRVCSGRAAIGDHRVVACTTTGASTHHDVLKGLAPSVVIMEEAGEIAEPYLLTSLSPRTEKLIMIGDHKQLRPTVSTYALQRESGRGHDLNVSTFERLVNLKFPLVTLDVQHRMRPEISSLVRSLVYPSLEDAPGTRGRDNVPGLASNVVFVHHEDPEDSDGGHTMHGRTTSKSNLREAARVACYVQHLLLQDGVEPKDIVVLTPYAGQLAPLRKELRRQAVKAVIGERDVVDLQAKGQGPLVGNGDEDETACVRVATVDNFQGEEARIVVISLVRSNLNNDTGFIRYEQRVNVLLSRARDGLVLVGNAHTLQGSIGSNVWPQLITSLRQRPSHMCIMTTNGLPVRCARHPREEFEIRDAIEARTKSPEGGCARPCEGKLECGHACPRRCHAGPHGECRQVINDFCSGPMRHELEYECFRGKPSRCDRCRDDELAAMRRTQEQRKVEAELAAAREDLRRTREQADHEKRVMRYQRLLLRVEQRRAEVEAERAAIRNGEGVDDTDAEVDEEINGKRCALCLDMVDPSDGVSCDQVHFMCDACVEGYTASLDPSSLDRHDGGVPCFEPRCESGPLANVESHISQVAIDKLTALRTDRAARVAREDAERLAREARQRERERSARDQAVAAARAYVENVLLVLQCPNGHAFYDFDGCCALKCKVCSVYFCAYCLERCQDNQDAHAHVARCRWNDGGDLFFSSEESYRRRTRQRQREELDNYLREQVQAEHLDAVREAIEPLARDLREQD